MMLGKLNNARATLIFFIAIGIIWYGLARFLPNLFIRDIVIVCLTLPFCGVFLWSLFSTLKRIFADKGNLWKELILTIVNVIIFLLAFSGVYQQIGIIDNTRDGSPITQDFWLCLYYSIITFTSTGYGDFHPQSIGRILASIHALVGYLVLGLMASTSMSVIQWKADGSGVNRGTEK